ncbi:putative MPP superfamily phosphohydrolase [Thermocatellispora tengchongensis]|uniref:Putative MPP superfamily phosphohydrolase n=1 Tax=Thermocatellispora tengchongensis TaxID=1073253 RepID=A0A840PGA0_9ACTN|nr:metallophosphoesterase [Thermocatellispora tengchongensis]MBB5138598.1 putative MPP superfamily phosphohydrolase [Thermocatellispora tengchongensis]
MNFTRLTDELAAWPRSLLRRTGEWAGRAAPWSRHPAVRRGAGATLKIFAVVLVAGFGAWLGVALSGGVRTPVGPVDVGMTLRPAWSGETVVDVHPLGTLLFDTHDAPVRLRVTLENIDQDQARSMIEDPRLADRLPALIEDNLREGLISLIARSVLFAFLGAALAGLIVFRSLRTALAAFSATVLAVGGTAGLVALTFRPQALVEPRYTGILAGAPSLVGSAESIVTRFESYRAQLTKLVSNVSKLYNTVDTLPVYDADPNTIRVLHVSDIHINPIAWNLIRSVSSQFKVNLIIDTGDLTDHGSRPEDTFVKEIGRLGLPYVFVRGNHDSRATERAVARQKNAVVLDDKAATVAGLRIYGLGDPRFTPDKTVAENSDPNTLLAYGRSHATDLTAAHPPTGTASTRAAKKQAQNQDEAVDIVAVHDPNVAKGFSGHVPIALAGHAHARSTQLLPSGTRVFVQGSTGGAGLRALEHEEPTPVMASVLYFDKDTHRLEAWDDITLGGLGEQSVQIQRHVEPDPERTISPEATTAPSPTGSAEPTATPDSD